MIKTATKYMRFNSEPKKTLHRMKLTNLTEELDKEQINKYIAACGAARGERKGHSVTERRGRGRGEACQ